MAGNLYDNGYLTIGQFSELADLSEHTLRYYEKVGVFLPVCRSKGSVAGYRLYSPTQLTTIKSIRTWAKAGASLEEIGELMRHRTPEIALLEFQECDNKLEEKANFIADSRQFNDIVKRLLEKSFHVNKAEIVKSKRVETAIILGKENDFIGANGYIRELTRFCKTQCGSEVNSPYPIAGYFNSMHDFTNAPSQPNRGVQVCLRPVQAVGRW